MRTNIKFHTIAISIIVVIIILLYVLIGPKQHAAVIAQPQAGDRQVEIVSATWGENCNSAIDEALHEQKSSPPVKDGQGNIIPYMPLKKATPNNVLTALGDLCNHKFICELPTDSETLGVDPMPACYKRLSVNYRCFTFDRLNTIESDQGSMLKIDCTAVAPTPAANAPAIPAVH